MPSSHRPTVTTRGIPLSVLMQRRYDEDNDEHKASFKRDFGEDAVTVLESIQELQERVRKLKASKSESAGDGGADDGDGDRKSVV